MRKVFGLVCAMMFVAGTAFAQDYATKGLLEFGVSEQYGDVITNLVPEVHYFVADNISLGGQLNNFATKTGNVERTGTEILLNPRYVANIESENIYPFGGLLLGISKDTYENTNTNYKDETSITKFGVEAGIKIKVTESGMLNFGLRYLTSSGTEKVTGFTDVDSDASNLNLRIGFTFYK